MPTRNITANVGGNLVTVPLTDFIRKMRNFNEGRYYTDLEKATRHKAVFKPQRKLAAPWMDDFIQTRRAVSLCWFCNRKYGRDIERFFYIASPWPALTDCDGCSKHNAKCTTYFSGESKTGKVLNKNKK